MCSSFAPVLGQVLRHAVAIDTAIEMGGREALAYLREVRVGGWQAAFTLLNHLNYLRLLLLLSNALIDRGGFHFLSDNKLSTRVVT